MTVAELQEKLRCFDPGQRVLINVRQYNKAYGVAQLEPYNVTGAYQSCTLHVSLPQGKWVVQRKGS